MPRTQARKKDSRERQLGKALKSAASARFALKRLPKTKDAAERRDALKERLAHFEAVAQKLRDAGVKPDYGIKKLAVAA